METTGVTIVIHYHDLGGTAGRILFVFWTRKKSVTADTIEVLSPEWT
jgi:hypothetical protein